MKHYFLLALLFVFASSCRKDKDKVTQEEHHVACVDGHIRWFGHPAADGLGWVLEKTNESQIPELYVLKDLPAGYQVDGLAVNACVYLTDERVNCMCMKYYSKITTIKRR